jgi:hypothetical protein
VVTAAELARVTATNLHEEFATVVNTAGVLREDPTLGSGMRDPRE